MAAFEYSAIANDGKRLSGTIIADSPRAARRELRLRALTPVSVTEAGHARNSSSARTRFREKDRTLLTRQLAVLLGSGMTVEGALTATAGSSERAEFETVLLQARAEVMEGTSFADALLSAPRAFPPLYRSIVAAGEASGKLPAVLDQLATHLERSYRVRTLVRSALVYPVILGLMAVLMVTGLMVFIVPRLVEQFDLLGAGQLPLLTEIVIAVSGFFRNWGLVLLGSVILAVMVFRRALRIPRFRRQYDGFLLRLPYVGDLSRKVAAARFARIYATLSASGAPVLESLKGAKAAMQNTIFIEAAAAVAESVREGRNLSAAMKATRAFPPLLVHMAQSGEAARDVPGMLNRAADFLEAEFETSTTVAMGLLEPAIIIFLGLVVGTIVLSIMLPIIQLNTVAMNL